MISSNSRTLIVLGALVLLTVTCNLGPLSLSWSDTPGTVSVTGTPGASAIATPSIAAAQHAASPQSTRGALVSPAPSRAATPRAASTSTTPVAPTFPAPTPAFVRLNLVAEENGGRIVSVTDELDEYPASNLIDGCKLDYCEWWTNEPPEFPQVVVFAFAGDQVKTINQVVLNPWTSEWRYAWVEDFEIHVSTSSPRLSDMKKVGAFTLEHLGVDQSFTFAPVAAKYVALVVKSHYGGEAGITLNEFEVYEAPTNARAVNPGNLTAAQNGGRIVAFSSEDPSGDWDAVNLIDGDKESSGWSSAEDLKTLQYVVFAFKGDRPRQIDRVILNPYSADYQEDWIQDFELRVSETTTDPKAMQSLGRFRLEKVGRDQQFTFTPVRARYIALVPLTNYGGTAFALNEFEVYEASAPPDHLTRINVPTPAGTPGPAIPTPPPADKGTQVEWSSRNLGPSAPVDNIEVDIVINDILPTVYHLYGDYFDDMARVTLTNHNAFPIKARVEAVVTNYTDAAIQTVTLAPNEETSVALNPPFLPGVFERLTEAKKANLRIVVDYLKEGERRLIYEDTTTITIWSQGDTLLSAPGFHSPYVFIATLAVPNDPALDRILRNAADYAPGGIIRWGYEEEGDKGKLLYNKLKAIYRAVADEGVIYVATGIPFVPREERYQGLYLQRIKLPYQVLATRSGMCLETSLLFASLYEKIMLDPVIIYVPGHAYLAVPVSEGSSAYYFIETTLVGRGSFEEAIRAGAENFKEHYPYLKKDRADSYFWVKISALRQEGILPIPWR